MDRRENIIKIKDLVETNSWFQLDGDVDDFDDDGNCDIVFVTRENGNVGDEEHSQEDWDEGERILLLVMKNYGHLVSQYNLDTCDEWVNLDIILK